LRELERGWPTEFGIKAESAIEFRKAHYDEKVKLFNQLTFKTSVVSSEAGVMV